jgi:outer membrane protein OmpA-like peptidoglycan-associated protein
MKRIIVGCVIGLVFCMVYAKAGLAKESTKVENSDCRGKADYRDSVCKGWTELIELQRPAAWDYALRSHHEKHHHWYGAGEGATKGKMVRLILEGVQFDSNMSNLRPDTIPILERNVAKLKAMQYSFINVIGYTDSQGKEEYNQDLSEKRAQAVKDYLVKQGIASDHIMVVGRGESGAIAPNVTPSGKDYPAGRAKNRRAIEFHIWTQ